MLLQQQPQVGREGCAPPGIRQTQGGTRTICHLPDMPPVGCFPLVGPQLELPASPEGRLPAGDTVGDTYHLALARYEGHCVMENLRGKQKKHVC